jgi:hypothetical protein
VRATTATTRSLDSGDGGLTRRPVQSNRGIKGVKLYSIRVKGHLGAMSLAAFPEMVSQERGADCVLTGVLPDHSALFGIVTQIEALGLELVEIRLLVPNPEQSERKG